MLIDTHAHLNFKVFEDDLDKVIEHSLAENIWMINVGSKYETSKKAVEIAESYREGIFAAVGLHPIHADSQEFDRKKYRELASSKKVVAIEEVGLDYYYRPKTKRKLEIFKEKQKETFLEQLNLAKELKLPVIFHCRMAHQNLIEILKSKIKNQKVISDLLIVLAIIAEMLQPFLPETSEKIIKQIKGKIKKTKPLFPKI